MANTDVRGTRQRKPRTKKTQVVEDPIEDPIEVQPATGLEEEEVGSVVPEQGPDNPPEVDFTSEDQIIPEETEIPEEAEDIVVPEQEEPTSEFMVEEEEVILDGIIDSGNAVEFTGEGPIPTEKKQPKPSVPNSLIGFRQVADLKPINHTPVATNNDIVLVKKGSKYFVCKGTKRLTDRPVLLEKAKSIAAKHGQPDPEIR